jgi:wyosine [tRNA(Phe)-imidazoG37] synthetase (radical SAM superfamily)
MKNDWSDGDVMQHEPEQSQHGEPDEAGARFEFGSCRDSAKLPPIVFGPVPSRRLGRSLGINNIPPKVCSYSCAYCQVGPTMDRAVEPRQFYPPARIAAEVSAQVERVRGESIDYLTFVPDGEPTLDAGLGESIRLLGPLGIDIAVISNGSLLARPDVREALASADWVSVKVDAATEAIWRQVNRPDPSLHLAEVQDGIGRFAAEFDGRLVSETMLIKGVNDGPGSVAAVGDFLVDVGIATAYLAIPTRPTPYPAITAPNEATVNRAFQVLAGLVPRVEYLIGYEGDEFASTGDPRADLLAITAVHPMRASAMTQLLARTASSWEVVDDLVAQGHLTEVTHRGERYYVRRWRR